MPDMMAVLETLAQVLERRGLKVEIDEKKFLIMNHYGDEIESFDKPLAKEIIKAIIDAYL